MGDFEIIIDPFAIFAFLNFIFLLIILLYESKHKKNYGSIILKLSFYSFMLYIFIYFITMIYTIVYDNNIKNIGNRLLNITELSIGVSIGMTLFSIYLIELALIKKSISFNDWTSFSFILFVFPFAIQSMENEIAIAVFSIVFLIVFFIFPITSFFIQPIIGIILFCIFLFIILIFIKILLFVDYKFYGQTITYLIYVTTPLYIILFLINFSIQTMKFIIFLEEKDLRD